MSITFYNTNDPKQIILSNLTEKDNLLGVNENKIDLASNSIKKTNQLPNAHQNNLSTEFQGGQYIHPGGLFNRNWKGLVTDQIIDQNSGKTFGTISSIQIKLNVPTSSRPQINFPSDGFTYAANDKSDPSQYNRAPRGLSSIYNYADPSNNPNIAIIGRYSGIYTTARGRGAGRTGSLNPIKHWRKQLSPSQGHITGKPSLNHVMWNPGGTTLDNSCCLVNLNQKDWQHKDQKGILNQYLANGYRDIENCNCSTWTDKNGIIHSTDVIRNSLSNYQPVYFNNPERVVRPRSSQTKIKKNYFTTGAAYLKSRVKLYEQNQLLSTANTMLGKSNELFMQNGKPLNQELPPSNQNWVYAENTIDKNGNRVGSQAFNSTYCVSDPSACCHYKNEMDKCQVPITFKPNNPFFAKQGAVDSSTRILQAKYNTIITNNNDFAQGNDIKFANVAGKGMNVYLTAGKQNSKVITLPGATPVKYRGDAYRSQAPYFVKNKYQRIAACSQNILNAFSYQSSIRSRSRLNGIGNREPSGGTGRTTVCFLKVSDALPPYGRGI
ncbi:hypothetical protein ceV_295 [Chrysochromulina ericina virus CeV-01B]|uniref:Uncharacterized protein n=1 Tax=Chrysochromulina ericina virus CeV-01B TaxID=3070830 RepID=A0A0N7G7M5_9VIRU|nr:hypothetical protein ceV_295 [Chrysochromulina ericina virus]ALH23201.1 hypothetical protein ceV_295 [Chrysochromulina ericina virus CeV-01B]